jgi:hypothetical protein
MSTVSSLKDAWTISGWRERSNDAAQVSQPRFAVETNSCLGNQPVFIRSLEKDEKARNCCQFCIAVFDFTSLDATKGYRIRGTPQLLYKER